MSSARFLLGDILTFRYQVLAVATETKTKEDAQNQKSGKRVSVSLHCMVLAKAFLCFVYIHTSIVISCYVV